MYVIHHILPPLHANAYSAPIVRRIEGKEEARGKRNMANDTETEVPTTSDPIQLVSKKTHRLSGHTVFLVIQHKMYTYQPSISIFEPGPEPGPECPRG